METTHSVDQASDIWREPWLTFGVKNLTSRAPNGQGFEMWGKKREGGFGGERTKSKFCEELKGPSGVCERMGKVYQGMNIIRNIRTGKRK